MMRAKANGDVQKEQSTPMEEKPVLTQVDGLKPTFHGNCHGQQSTTQGIPPDYNNKHTTYT